MICESLKTIDYDAIIINEPIKNSVLQYNYFYKLLYSTPIVVLTSIFLLFELNCLSISFYISFHLNIIIIFQIKFKM